MWQFIFGPEGCLKKQQPTQRPLLVHPLPSLKTFGVETESSKCALEVGVKPFNHPGNYTLSSKVDLHRISKVRCRNMPTCHSETNFIYRIVLTAKSPYCAIYYSPCKLCIASLIILNEHYLLGVHYISKWFHYLDFTDIKQSVVLSGGDVFSNISKNEGSNLSCCGIWYI